MIVPTLSEEFITNINQNVFYKEFTFDRSEILIDQNNVVELADNILWIDDILIVFQIKERNSLKSDSKSNIGNWFSNKVLKKAKEQIKKSNEWIRSCDSIPLKNKNEQILEMHPGEIEKIINVVLYHINETIPETFNPEIKYKTQDGLFIHIFSSVDYFHICRYLETPAELRDYLNFREDLLSFYPTQKFSEQYILAHYFHNSNDLQFNASYIDDLEEICNDIECNDSQLSLSAFLNKFRDSVVPANGGLSYIEIVKELAKLNRQEIFMFKQRLLSVLTGDFQDPFNMKAMYFPRTDCSFIVMKPPIERYPYLETILHNTTEDYKYARHASKGLGAIVLYESGDVLVYWCLISTPWKYDASLEETSKGLLSFFEGKLVKEKYLHDFLKHTMK